MSGKGSDIVQESPHGLLSMIERNFSDITADSSGENLPSGFPANLLIFWDGGIKRIPVTKAEPGSDAPLGK